VETISEILTKDHKRIDDIYSEVENFIVKKSWDEAGLKVSEFSSALNNHLQAEEECLFNEFERKTGNTMGPTQVMRMEHDQMRQFVTQISRAITEKNYSACAGNMETLMILIQQHNMKEENMLYRMCDQILSDIQEKIIMQIKERIS